MWNADIALRKFCREVSCRHKSPRSIRAFIVDTDGLFYMKDLFTRSMNTSRSVGWFCLLALSLLAADRGSLEAAETLLRVGVASIDITPDYPIRLNGFGYRRTESEGITHPIYAKALAFADEKDGPAITITTDNLCVPDGITKSVADRLKHLGLKLERLSITATHTHTAPMLVDVAPTIFGTNIPPEHWSHVERYTREFTDKLVQVAETAVKDVQPAQVSWGVGEVNFSINRRTQGGPVDHDLPALFVRSPEGKVRAVYFSYACHCVTLGHNKISGDWSGYAQEAVQKVFPGAVALASVGCGADSNPNARGSATNLVPAISQGQEVADEVKRLAGAELRPITVLPSTRYDRVDLLLDTARTKDEWEQRTHSDQYAVVYHAKLNLARLERGEKLPTSLNYPIQTWLFGDQLALVFMPGETVVDYSLRLKREYDKKRLWINGYSNDGRCYIPSERILREGGYEGGDAMIYYDRPQRFAPGVEQRIFDVLYKQLPKSFSSGSRTEGTRPLSPDESLRAIHTKHGLKVELVASEPLIADPVAIDWAADGRLWVCEMNDYPAGLDGNWQPGGRVKVLKDTNGDGVYDQATLFAEDIPFPTGVTAWGKGVFICAAPDILYAEDTDGDGKADRIEKLYSGFFTDNFQARVNSLQLGLDNWIYGANGLLGGTITSRAGSAVNIRNHDFRFNPFGTEFETVTGLSQQGRVRDDWGNWFGCNNSELLLHFGLPECYLRRNPHVDAPPLARNLTSRPEGNRLFPQSRLLDRFNDIDQANRTTSACGVGIYRDTMLGEEYYGNAFTCEVVHNLVHREIVSDDDGRISSARAVDEMKSEFLASEDNWFRPAQVRTGPDGALYVVDMYRFLIEHPRWIPAARLAKIDVRAGSDMGRIYRIRAEGKNLRPIRDLTKLSGTELAAAIDSPNGTERDRVHAEIVTRRDANAASELKRLATSAKLPQVRVQALSALEGLGQITGAAVVASLRDSDPHVRAQALQISERLLRSNPVAELANAVTALTNDPSTRVLEQLALTLGEWNDPRAGDALAKIAVKAKENDTVRAAVLTSAAAHCVPLLDAISAVPVSARGREPYIVPLIATASAGENEADMARAFALASEANDFRAYVPILEALDRRQVKMAQFIDRHPSLRSAGEAFQKVLVSARATVADANMPAARRQSALALFNRKTDAVDDLKMLCSLAARDPSETVRSAALSALRHQSDPLVARELIARWSDTPRTTRTQVIALLLSREQWAAPLLEAVRSGTVAANEIPAGDQQTALHSPNEKIQQLARSAFASQSNPSRGAVLAAYQSVGSLKGQPAKGAEVFSLNCAPCHHFGNLGVDVGPNLVTLSDKDAEYLVKNILDPNAMVDAGFAAYNVELKDDRSLTGLIKSESANSILLLQGGGTTERINRGDIASIQASKFSLMPEGFENSISPQQMADLIAFVKQSEPRARGTPELVLRDPASIARLILDASQPNELRNTAISANPQYAAELIREMTRDFVPGTPEEYVRIPWIWRVAVAAGKRHDGEQMKRILDVSLPRSGLPLRDWQAVVVGGGLINGVSQRGIWPRERFEELVASEAGLKERWNYSLKEAAVMANNMKVPDGTRYDAIRMLGVTDWETNGARLKALLEHGNAELQMGAVSALGDMNTPEATRALVEKVADLNKGNQQLAITALFRTQERKVALREAIDAKKLPIQALSEEDRKQLGPWNQ